MRVFILIAMLTALAACDGGGPTLQKGKGPVTQTDDSSGLPVGAESTQQSQTVQSAASP